MLGRTERDSAMTHTVRIAYLHHSTGEIVWRGGIHRHLFRLAALVAPAFVSTWVNRIRPLGVPGFITAWNAAHGTEYRIRRLTYPATKAGYPWANYPFDYWNLWVAHTDRNRDRGEFNLDDLTRDYDVIVFKHCFPVSRMVADAAASTTATDAKTLGNYKSQYEALKRRLHQFPSKKFILWTGPPLSRAATNPEEALRAQRFFEWVTSTWDERGDNIFLWDYRSLAVAADGCLAAQHEASPGNSHPSAGFARTVAPLIGRRIVDVIEGRGDAASSTGI
jgi:hypothetical protein